MARFYVRMKNGPWWREPHWGFSYDMDKAHAYDCQHATDRQHIEWGLKTFPGQLILRAIPDGDDRDTAGL